ncbi:MAG: serine hydrolase [Erysipelotrichaceae bacterium]|nr:serine hydrolase [Erysipelotrichaceae bacterium]
MPVKKTNLKRKVNYTRLAILGGAAVLVIGCVVFAAVKGTSGFGSAKKNDDIILDTGETVKREDITALRKKIDEVIGLKNLAKLKTDISTFLFNNQLSGLQDEINSYMAANNIDTSKVAYAIQDLSTGAYLKSDNAAVNSLAASTYKLPLCMIWYERIANGQASPDQEFVFTEAMLEKEDEENPTQPIALKYKVGDKIKLSTLLEAAALYSDNIAGHILFENLGGYSAFKHMITKYSSTQQGKDFFSDNNLNPDYTMDLVRTLYETTGTYDDLKFWLANAVKNLYLNGNNAYGYVQKIGNIQEVRNVIGYAPTEFPFSVSIYSQIGDKEGEKMIADIGEICWNYFQNKYDEGFYEAYDPAIAQARAAVGSPQEVLIYMPNIPEDQRSTLEHPHGRTGSDTSSQQDQSDTQSSDAQADSNN